MLSKIWAAIEAIKLVASIVNKVITMYEKYQDKKIDTHYEQKDKRRQRLIAQIKEAKETRNEELLTELHRKLRAIDIK